MGHEVGAYDYEELSADPFIFRFETASHFPMPIFDRLAEMFPSLGFHCACYDGDGGEAGEGWFNPPPGERAFVMGAATDELYERVYGFTRPDEDAG